MMTTNFSYLPYSETGYFSKLVTDYVCSNPNLSPFYNSAPNEQGITQAIVERAKYPVNRQNLVDTLTKQYLPLPKSEKTLNNINLLLNENTFTICTAHQPNLLTGYLYFIYKISHAIALAEELNKAHPQNHFVPVYYMGSEDNDLDELGTFLFRNQKYTWDGDGQKGAVGRMNTTGLQTMLNELFQYFGPPGLGTENLKHIITTAYCEHTTIGKATQYLVNELFGQYGLVVIDPDDASFKKEFIAIMKDELWHQNSYPILTQQINKLETHYKIQAHPRTINLFYLNNQLRERIEYQADKWVVLNTDIKWNEAELEAELNAHPECFSPNVMLRGLYQETILPNVAFIGGGAEVAYWMQLKTLFEHYKIFFPNIHLRQSVLWLTKENEKNRQKLNINVADLFKTEAKLIRDFIAQNSPENWQTTNESHAIEGILNTLEQKATLVDPTLQIATKATLAKMKNLISQLEQKMLKAEKRKNETQVSKIIKLKTATFPNNSLQERIENFTEYYLLYGNTFFDTLLKGMKPFKHEFLVVEIVE